MKNILKYVVLAGVGVGVVGSVFGQEIWKGDKPYEYLPENTTTEADKVDLGQEAKNATLKDTDKSLTEKIADLYGLQVGEEGATNYIKFVVNLLLSLLFFVCVALLIYGFYMVLVSSKYEDSYKKAIKILYAAGFGIVVIGLSFFIAQIMFGIYFKAKNATANTAPNTANPSGTISGPTAEIGTTTDPSMFGVSTTVTSQNQSLLNFFIKIDVNTTLGDVSNSLNSASCPNLSNAKTKCLIPNDRKFDNDARGCLLQVCFQIN